MVGTFFNQICRGPWRWSHPSDPRKLHYTVGHYICGHYIFALWFLSIFYLFYT